MTDYTNYYYWLKENNQCINKGFSRTFLSYCGLVARGAAVQSVTLLAAGPGSLEPPLGVHSGRLVDVGLSLLPSQ